MEWKKAAKICKRLGWEHFLNCCRQTTKATAGCSRPKPPREMVAGFRWPKHIRRSQIHARRRPDSSRVRPKELCRPAAAESFRGRQSRPQPPCQLIRLSPGFGSPANKGRRLRRSCFLPQPLHGSSLGRLVLQGSPLPRGKSGPRASLRTAPSQDQRALPPAACCPRLIRGAFQEEGAKLGMAPAGKLALQVRSGRLSGRCRRNVQKRAISEFVR